MKILIIEDEAVIARRLERLTRELLASRLERLDHARRLREARAALASVPYDIVLLDLNLYGQDGFSLLDHAVAGSFDTIVVSAYGERALEGFDHGVVDFVAKPVNRQRLGRAFERILERRGSRSRLAIRKRAQVHWVEIDTIVFLQGAGDYVEVHTADGETHLHDQGLGHLEALLPRVLLRIHRSYIVDLRRAVRLRSEPGSRYFLVLEEDLELPVGRSRVETVRRRLLEV